MLYILIYNILYIYIYLKFRLLYIMKKIIETNMNLNGRFLHLDYYSIQQN